MMSVQGALARLLAHRLTFLFGHFSHKLKSKSLLTQKERVYINHQSTQNYCDRAIMNASTSISTISIHCGIIKFHISFNHHWSTLDR